MSKTRRRHTVQSRQQPWTAHLHAACRMGNISSYCLLLESQMPLTVAAWNIQHFKDGSSPKRIHKFKQGGGNLDLAGKHCCCVWSCVECETGSYHIRFGAIWGLSGTNPGTERLFALLTAFVSLLPPQSLCKFLLHLFIPQGNPPQKLPPPQVPLPPAFALWFGMQWDAECAPSELIQNQGQVSTLRVLSVGSSGMGWRGHLVSLVHLTMRKEAEFP